MATHRHFPVFFSPPRILICYFVYNPQAWRHLGLRAP